MTARITSEKIAVAVLTVCVSSQMMGSVGSVTTPVCVDGDKRGSNTCSFICGLNGQFYPENAPSDSFGNDRCPFPGQPVSHTCAQVCIEGVWVTPPCGSCCTDYSDNHCNIGCSRGVYAVEEGCDPLNPLAGPSTNPTSTAPVKCVNGEQRGQRSCAYICGLNGQYFPSNSPGDGFGNERCPDPGQPVRHRCPESCIDGRWQPIPCAPCCTEYPDNHCQIECQFGTQYSVLPRGCDPLNPPVEAVEPPAVCVNGTIRGQNTCGFICGLNDQWLAKLASGTESQRRCQRRGEFVPPFCNKEACFDGQWVPVPCDQCCQDYPNNPCAITCTVTGSFAVEDGCDPFASELSTTSGPPCTEGAVRGQMTCGYICAVNNQWYPQTASGETVHSHRCSRPGQFVQGMCPEICGAGKWVPIPCYRCCQKYPRSFLIDRVMDVLCDKRLV